MWAKQNQSEDSPELLLELLGKRLSYPPGVPAVRTKHLELLLTFSDTIWGAASVRPTQRQTEWPSRPSLPGMFLVLALRGPFPGSTLRPGQTGIVSLPTERQPSKKESWIYCSNPWSSFVWRPSLKILFPWLSSSLFKQLWVAFLSLTTYRVVTHSQRMCIYK